MQIHECQRKYILEYLLAKMVQSTSDPVNIESNECWGTTQAKKVPNNPRPQSRLTDLAKAAGEIFEEVIVKIFRSIHQKPFKHQDIVRSIQFFLDPYLPGSKNGDSPLLCIAKTVYQLGGELPDQSVLIKKLLIIVFKQHLFDPKEFTSHGFDHSLNVARYCESIFRRHKRISKSFCQRYDQLSTKQLIGCIRLHAYLHDCGYPYLCDRAKTNHAVYSADKTDRIKDSLKKILGKRIGLGVSFKNFYSEFRLAIFQHNADGVAGPPYGAKLSTDSGVFLLQPVHVETVKRVFSKSEPDLREARRPTWQQPEMYEEGEGNKEEFSGRGLDLFFPGDRLLGHQFRMAYLDSNPFDLIRIADNLDITSKRITGFQQQRYFSELCQLRYYLGLTKDQLKELTPEKVDRLRQAQKELLKECLDLVSKHPDLKEIEKNIDMDSLKHFGGCYSLSNVKLHIKFHRNRTVEAKVKVDINKDLWDILTSNGFKHNFTEKEKQGGLTVAQYQMYRTWIAFQSVFVKQGDRPFAVNLHFIDRTGQIPNLFDYKKFV